jgi:hypothetical protein
MQYMSQTLREDIMVFELYFEGVKKIYFVGVKKIYFVGVLQCCNSQMQHVAKIELN